MEPECLRFDVLTGGQDDRREVFLYELYVSAKSFEHHLTLPHFTTFDAATQRMVVKKTVNTYRAAQFAK